MEREPLEMLQVRAHLLTRWGAGPQGAHMAQVRGAVGALAQVWSGGLTHRSKHK